MRRSARHRAAAARSPSRGSSSARATPGRFVACVCLAVLSGCAADQDARAKDPPTYESRTGVPVLMDLPLIGWLFQHHVVVR